MSHQSIRRIMLAAVVVALPAIAEAGALTDILVAKLGVTQPQADGGAGSIFKLARAQMTPENFQKLNAVVPGMSAYLGAAPAFLPGEQASANMTPGGGLGQGAALAGAAGAGTSVGALAAAAGGRSTAGTLAAAAAVGSPAGSIAAAAGGGSTTGALAAAALGQPVSPTDALKGAARDKLAASVGGAVPGAQGGLAGVAAGALAGNAGGQSGVGAAGALLAGTAVGDKLQAVQALAPAFSQLGMNQGSVAQFLPIVVGYVKSVGGKSSSKLLTHALGL
ncbi:MAG: DUF2780 domain-containing protein [Proteobacteria bacterium]|nr:DUF2780 domain-containing protein [Pseudomonadota bacterium]